MNSTFQVMRFHRGEYLGTTFSEPRRGHPEVEQLTEAVVKVAYPYTSGLTGVDDGVAVSHFRWDPASGTVQHTGQMPVTDADAHVVVEGDPPSGPVELVGSPYSGAGGAAPAGARQITSYFETAHSLPTAVFLSPSGNVGCALEGTSGFACGSKTLASRADYGSIGFGLMNEAGAQDGEIPVLYPTSDAPVWSIAQAEGPIDVLGYGESATYGTTACVSEQTGKTCWDTRTGHGLMMNKKGWVGF